MSTLFRLCGLAVVLVSLIAMTSSARADVSWPDLSAAPAGKADGHNDVALIVGIEKYAFAPPVPGAAQNARDWANYFAETRGLPFGSYKVLLDGDGTVENIRAAAQDLAGRIKPGGTMWFVFIGHGAPVKDGSDGLLLGADVQQTEASLSARSLPQRELTTILGKGPQARTVVTIDACFSGLRHDGAVLMPGIEPWVRVNIAPVANTILLLGAQAGQFAGALPGAKRPAFSYLVLGALRGWADENKDGNVTAAEVAKFAQTALWTLVKDRTQTPEMHGDPGTVLADNATEARPDLTKLARSLDEAASPVVSASAVTTTAPPPPPAAAPHSGYWRTAGLVTMAGGVAVMGVGAYFGLHARSLASEISDGKTYNAAKDDERGSAVNKQYIGYGVGGAALVGGLLMVLLGDGHSNVALVPSVGPQYAGFSFLTRTR